MIVVVADNKIEFTVRGLLGRTASLGIRDLREPEYDIRRNGRDPGCRCEAHNFLRLFINQYNFALVMFDREGSGSADPREQIEAEVEGLLSANGWQGRCAVVVFDPELESWVFSDSPHVGEVLGWRTKSAGLSDWLRAKGLLGPDQIKPQRPKEAMEAALKESRTAFSSSLYKQLAQKVGLNRCQDPSFAKFKDVLRKWFPPA
jgi:hypothetical protein